MKKNPTYMKKNPTCMKKNRANVDATMLSYLGGWTISENITCLDISI